MDSRKQQYKAISHKNPTLSERVRKDRGRRVIARQDKFAGNRRILDISPEKQNNPPKIANITDRAQKLKAYRLQKNTQAINQIQKQKSPFIVAVPVGRWVEKKERVQASRIDFSQTPVRNALMNERVMKKSTIKDLIAKSTVKKENVMIFGKNIEKTQPSRSKKRILGELNAVVQSSNDQLMTDISKLNDTFEILPALEDEIIDDPPKRLRRSNSLPEIVHKVKFVGPSKSSTKAATLKAVKKPAVKAVPLRKPLLSSKSVVSKSSSAVTARAALHADKPVIRKNVVAKIAKPVRVPKHIKSNERKDEEIIAELEDIVEQVKAPKPIAKQKNSQTFELYKSMLDTQLAYLKLQLDEIESEKKKFFESLEDDQQMSIQMTIQQGNLLMSEKLKKFAEFLDQYEADRSQPENPKKLSKEDIDNYWFLLYEEIDETKKSLDDIRVLKKKSNEKKRRSRRAYLPEEGTPKRSKRIADTPKHSASCYGCVTMSASKTNTPRSNKRRTTMKKSVLFDSTVQDTPTASNSRRSSKRYKATPKRSLARMNAIDDDDDDINLCLM